MGVYDRSAAAYDVIERSLGRNYESDAAFIAALVRAHCPAASAVLDVGCGSGRHLDALRGHFSHVAGVELSAGMVAEAARLYPDIKVEQADMRSFALEQTFDAVISLSGSIGYMTTVEDLGLVLGNMAAHLADGGVVVVEGYFTPEEWQPGRLGTHVASEPGIGVGRLMATSGGTSGGATSGVGQLDMSYLILAGGRVEHVDETHLLGLFTEEQYEAAFAAAGLQLTEATARLGATYRLRVGTRPTSPAGS